jgi:5-methylcytosine-specific restriction endonuclease McrA
VKLRGRKCENCGITEWLGQPINLEIHHINGDRSDNSLNNLMILCPNCHSYTSNFRRRKDKYITVKDEDFVFALQQCQNIA